MPKRTKGLRGAPPAEETHKIYARAYASRLARQVRQEFENPRGKTPPRKKRDTKA